MSKRETSPASAADGTVCRTCGGAGDKDCRGCGGDGWEVSRAKEAERVSPKKVKPAKRERLPIPPVVSNIDGDSRNRDWLHPDGRCIICEEPEATHNLQARRDCRDEYLRLAAELTQENEDTMAKDKTKKKNKAKGAAAGKPATTMPNGQTSTQIMDGAAKGKTALLDFKGDGEEAVKVAYTFWSMRRRRGLGDEVEVSLNREAATVTVGPVGTKAQAKKATKAEKPAKKDKAAKKTKKAAKADKPKRKKKKAKKATPEGGD